MVFRVLLRDNLPKSVSFFRWIIVFYVSFVPGTLPILSVLGKLLVDIGLAITVLLIFSQGLRMVCGFPLLFLSFVFVFPFLCWPILYRPWSVIITSESALLGFGLSVIT